MATLDQNLLNRGMGFDAEMSRYCGRTAGSSRVWTSASTSAPVGC